MNRDFLRHPNRFVARLIHRFVAQSPLNRLEDFDGDPIFEEPVIGFASGDDPVFEQFRSVVHPEHLFPREILGRAKGCEFQNVTVVSFALPVHEKTRRANAKEKRGPARRWNHTRWLGQAFIDALCHHIVMELERIDVPSVAPELTESFSITQGPYGIASLWSQRHVAYAAGLGTFGLSDALITHKGSAVRFGSVVIGHEMEITERPYIDHHAYCLFYRMGKCGRCMKRCPRGAISAQGHDKMLCYEILTKDQQPWLEGAYGPGYMGKYAGCGLCMTGVPCEGGIPSPE